MEANPEGTPVFEVGKGGKAASAPQKLLIRKKLSLIRAEYP